MIDKKLVCAVIIVWGFIACTTEKIPKSSLVRSNCGAAQKPNISDEINIQSNTVATLSNYAVGIANIFEREVPDDKGVIAPRMSAYIAIHNPKSNQTSSLEGFAGQVINVGTDKYCIVQVNYSESSFSSVTLWKMPSKGSRQ